MLKQLNPPIPVFTPKGQALAHMIIDYGPDHDLHWVCFNKMDGECWTWPNPMIRASRNITLGREYVAPFYEPKDVAFKKSECEKHGSCDECGECLNDCECSEDEAEYDYETLYNSKCEEYLHERKKWFSTREKMEILKTNFNSLKSIIKRLLDCDHVFPDARGEVFDVLEKVKEEDETIVRR